METTVTAATIQAQLSQLEGLPAWGGHLAADMLTIQFGQAKAVERKTGPTSLGRFALHIQNPWRVLRTGESTVAQQDYYSANGDEAIHAVWNRVTQLLPDTEPAQDVGAVVTDMILEPPTGFLLLLDNEVSIQVSPKVGIADNVSEAWRILEPDRDNRHFVVLSDGSIE